MAMNIIGDVLTADVIMPNTMLGAHPNHFCVFALRPVALGGTSEQFHLDFVGFVAMA